MDYIEKNKSEMLKKKVWAVVGATPNENKFGYKIFKKLEDFNYEVYLINPKYEEVEGKKCYPSLSELPVKPDVIDLVVPPKVSLKNVELANKLGIEYLWFQPGTADEEAIERSEELGLKIVYHDCVLVALDE